MASGSFALMYLIMIKTMTSVFFDFICNSYSQFTYVWILTTSLCSSRVLQKLNFIVKKVYFIFYLQSIYLYLQIRFSWQRFWRTTLEQVLLLGVISVIDKVRGHTDYEDFVSEEELFTVVCQRVPQIL